MRLWVMSDLHMELASISCRRAAPYDVMIVAGDLVTRIDRGVRGLRARVIGRSTSIAQVRYGDRCPLSPISRRGSLRTHGRDPGRHRLDQWFPAGP
jgi:3',5'-cyclic AMP phosphodiesterase CpdA